MQHIRSAILKHLRVSNSFLGYQRLRPLGPIRPICTSGKCDDSDRIMERVVGLVKKYDKIDGAKVTETADFQKDLCLDSLDRTELIMVFEEEFSIEIPDEKADKFACCADVTKYISEAKAPDYGNHT